MRGQILHHVPVIVDVISSAERRPFELSRTKTRLYPPRCARRLSNPPPSLSEFRTCFRTPSRLSDEAGRTTRSLPFGWARVLDRQD